VLVTQYVLPAQQHLQLGVLHLGADGPQAIPRILVQKSHAGVKGGAAPAFKGVVTYLVELFEHRQHFCGGHACGDQGLMRVTQDGFGNFHSHEFTSFPGQRHVAHVVARAFQSGRSAGPDWLSGEMARQRPPPLQWD
jgi:hypothetical protein